MLCKKCQQVEGEEVSISEYTTELCVSCRNAFVEITHTNALFLKAREVERQIEVFEMIECRDVALAANLVETRDDLKKQMFFFAKAWVE